MVNPLPNKDTTCPFCEREVNRSFCPEDGSRDPEEGHMSICLYCTGVGVFIGDGGLRKATKEDFESLKPDELMHLSSMLKVLSAFQAVKLEDLES